MVLEAAFLSKTRSPSYDKRMVGFEAAPSKTLKIDFGRGENRSVNIMYRARRVVIPKVSKLSIQASVLPFVFVWGADGAQNYQMVV